MRRSGPCYARLDVELGLEFGSRMAAFERRVRPVYDAIDSRNYKNALKLVNAALEKHANNDLLNALKALTLQRMGRVEEAHQLCDLLVGQSPTDDAVLHPLKLVLKELHRLSDITRLYELAHEQDPKDLDTLEKLFSAYVRESNYVKQQQTAMKLLKLSGNADVFQWWVITTIMLQARTSLLAGTPGASGSGLSSSTAAAASPPALPDPSKLLQLAESMVGRAVGKEGKLANFEALLLWVDLLLAAGKVKEAAQTLCAPATAGVASMAAERSMLHADLLTAEGELPAAAALLRDQLRSNPDDWSALQGYLDVVLPGSRPRGWLPGGCSSLAWLSGGTAEAMEIAGKAQRPGSGTWAGTGAGAGAGAAASTNSGSTGQATGGETGGAAEEAALKEAADLVEELVAAVGPLSGARGTPANATQPRLTMRGPHLARVELAWRAFVLARRTGGGAEGNGGGAGDRRADAAQHAAAVAVMGYYQEAGHLPSCAADLRPYLTQVDGAAREWLGQQLQAAAALGAQHGSHAASAPVAGADGNGRSLVDVARRRVCALQMLDDLGLPVLGHEQEAVTHAVALMQLFAECVPLYTGLDERERGPADELPPLAAAALVTAAACAPSPAAATRHMRHAVLLLEAATATRPHSAALRLALAALYTLLGCPERVNAHIRSLDIKHIQLETLGGHHLLPALLAFEVPVTGEGAGEGAKGGLSALPSAQGPQPLLRRLLRETATLFDDHHKDAGDTLFHAYRSHTYSKVLEFVAFKERLAASHTNAVVCTERALSEAHTGLLESGAGGMAHALALGLSSYLRSAGVPCDRAPIGGRVLRFNEDLATRPAWYTPCAQPLQLAPAAWWEGRTHVSGQGYGRRWWAVSGGAEAGSEAAAQLRAAHVRHVSVAWAAVHVLSGCLAAAGVASGTASGTTSGAAGIAHLLPLPVATAALARACGASNGDAAHDGGNAAADLGAWVRAAIGSCTGASCSSVTALEVAVLAAAVDTSAALSGQGSSTAAASLQQVQQLGAQVCAAIAEALQGEGVGGGALALASAVVQRPLAWLAALLEAWCGALRAVHHRSKKGGKGDSAGDGAPSSSSSSAAAADLSSAIAATRAWVSQALGALSEALGPAAALSKTQAAAAAQVLEPACPAVTSTAALWSWQPSSSRFNAGDVASRLVKEPATVAAKLQAGAQKLSRHLDKLPQLKQ